MICPDGHRDLTPDSATLSVGLFGAIDPHSEEFRNTVAAVERDLRIHGQIDGIARYAKDYYFRRTEDYPGNPWIICTMWLAQAMIALATDLDELGHAKFWLDWAIARAETTGVLAEQFHPETGEPLSVSPLTWSHAEYCRTVQDYVSRYMDLRNR
jgi:GH15 family glucan-1,4-alpha-glucosidase